MTTFSRVIEHVFGSSFLQTVENFDLESWKLDQMVSAINKQLQSQSVNDGSQERWEDTGRIKNDVGDGRVGSAKVSLDLLELSNIITSFDSFKIIGASHFGTVKTNCGVYAGKWQYEVLLLSTGVMQIGWATNNSKFGTGQGVGDTADSYAFDGSRVCKWNVISEDYGEKWEEDDIIGCCIDLDESQVEFFRNGRSMGVAYKDILMGAGIVYFPTVSMQQKEILVANFGSTPFCYPIPGYRPTQEPPHKEIASMTYLLDCLSKLLALMDSRAVGPDPCKDGLTVSYEAVLMEVGKILVSNVTIFLTNPYILETLFIPFIRELCNNENNNSSPSQVRPSAAVTSPKSAQAWFLNNRKLNICLDLFWAFSETNDLKSWASMLVSRLTSKFQHNIRPLVLEFSQQKDAILVLHSLVRHKKFRHFLMNHVLFEGIKLPWFMNIKVSTFETNSVWETEGSIEINQRSYGASINRISSAVNSLEDLQIDLMLTLMDNSDGSEFEPSSRKIFLVKNRILRQQFYALHRVDPLKGPGSPLSVLRPFLLRLTRVLELLWAKELDKTTPDEVPCTKFYDGSISYYDMDRLGGVLLYLLKTYFFDLEQRLGVSQPLPSPSLQTQERDGPQSLVESSTSTVRNFPGNHDLSNLSTRIFDIFDDARIDAWSEQQAFPVSSVDNANQMGGAVDVQNFLSEILDSLILFHHMSMQKNSITLNIDSYQNKVKDIVQCLNEIKEAMKNYHSACAFKQQPEVLKVLELSYNVLLEHLNRATAHLFTLHALRYPDRNSLLFKVILNTMKSSAEDMHLLNFVPEFYLDCLVDILKELSLEAKSSLIPIEPSPDREDLMLEIVQFLCDHIDDQRIRIARAKDTLILALLDVVTTKNLVDVLHKVPSASRMNMIRFLLEPYENRAWANSNWILVRIWRGSSNCFACEAQWSVYCRTKLKPRPASYPIHPLNFDCDPYPSLILQEQIKNLLIDEPDLASVFINSVLNQLNWAFSEFIGMLQELQNASNRQERVLVESRQLKICATCFDLTLALLRVLEMVASVALPVFVRPDQPNSYFLLARLFQLLCQVLNRASSQDGCFHHITTLEIPGLENVDHLPILTSVCGILVAVLKDDMENFNAPSATTVPEATKTLLVEPSFQLSSFTFLLEDDPHLFSLNFYKDFITAGELAVVEKMLTMLIHYHHIIATSSSENNTIDEDEVCTICFAFPISATFEPCKHRSCRACITHHLMNCRNCFFCKTVITKVFDEDGKVIHNVEQANLIPDAAVGGS